MFLVPKTSYMEADGRIMQVYQIVYQVINCK